MAYLSFRVVEKLVMMRRRKRSLVKSRKVGTSCSLWFSFWEHLLENTFLSDSGFILSVLLQGLLAWEDQEEARNIQGKSTYKPTRSSLTIRMTSDRLASPKMGVGRSLLHLAADHFYGQLPDQSCSGWKVLEVRWCYVVNYRSHMSSARNLKL